MFHFSKSKMKKELFNVHLLEFFVALVHTGQLIKTGENFGLSPAGSSRVLDKLRAEFKDQLFLSSNKGLTPTAYALEIYPNVVKTINQLHVLLEKRDFSPEQCNRIFRIACRGFLIGDALRFIVPKFHQKAPMAGIEIQHRVEGFADQLKNGEVDLVWVSNVPPFSDLHYMFLHEIKFSLICSKKHPLALKCLARGKGPTDKEIKAYPLILLKVGAGSIGKLIQFPKIVTTCELNFVLPLVDSTDYLCIAPEEASVFAQEHYDVTRLGLENSSIGLEDQKAYLVWNELTHKDPAHIWFRSLFKDWSRLHNEGKALPQPAES